MYFKRFPRLTHRVKAIPDARCSSVRLTCSLRARAHPPDSINSRYFPDVFYNQSGATAGRANIHSAEANNVHLAIWKGPDGGFESKVPVEIRNDVTRKPGGEASRQRRAELRSAELLPPNHAPCS